MAADGRLVLFEDQRRQNNSSSHDEFGEFFREFVKKNEILTERIQKIRLAKEKIEIERDNAEVRLHNMKNLTKNINCIKNEYKTIIDDHINITKDTFIYFVSIGLYLIMVHPIFSFLNSMVPSFYMQLILENCYIIFVLITIALKIKRKFEPHLIEQKKKKTEIDEMLRTNTMLDEVIEQF